MFLSKAELFHESSWALWFQHAAGLLPVSTLQSTSQDGECSLPLSVPGQLYLARQRALHNKDALYWSRMNLTQVCAGLIGSTGQPLHDS